MTEDDNKMFRDLWFGIVEAFDKDDTASQFLREDGEGGFSSGVYRMAREIDRLRTKCGEPPHREEGWEEREDEQIDSEIDAMLAAERAAKASQPS